jgi:hypothetical protein
MVVVAGEVPANHLVSYGKKTPVGAFRTSDSRFFADSRRPLIGTRRRIAGPACLTAFEAARVDVFSSAKEGAEEANFGLSGGKLIHAGGLQER